MLVEVIVLCTLSVVVCGDIDEGIIMATENFQGRISQSENRSFIEKLGNATRGSYSMIRMNYDVEIYNYNANIKPPVLYLRHEGQEGYNVERECFGGADFKDLFSYDSRVIPLKRFDRIPGLDRECVLRTDPIRLVCSGSLEVAVGKDVQWYVTMGYECKHIRLLDFRFSITISSFASVPCYNTAEAFSQLQGPMPFDLRFFRQTCATINPTYSTFNVIGLDDDGFLKTILFMRRAQESEPATSPCYQHYWFILCGLFLPSCEHGNVTLPCMEMCTDFKRGCNNSVGAIECNSLAHAQTNTCVNLHVNCGAPPEIPKHTRRTFANGSCIGSVVSYECVDGYKQAASHYTCGYSGHWAVDDAFKCVKESKQPPVYIIAGVSTGFLVILIITATVTAVYFKIEIILLRKKYLKQQWCVTRVAKDASEREYDAFIAYHRDDCRECEDYVRQELQGQLEEHGFRIYTDYSAPDLGSNMVRRIPDVIAQSSAVILVLNQHFLDSSWGEYELDQSFHQLIEDRNLDLIVIITDDPKSLTNVPRFLRAYLRTKMYFKGGDKNLIEKLRKVLPSPQTASSVENMAGSVASGLSLSTIHTTLAL